MPQGYFLPWRGRRGMECNRAPLAPRGSDIKIKVFYQDGIDVSQSAVVASVHE